MGEHESGGRLPTIWRVPDEFWGIAEPILRPAEHPKGGRPWTDTRRALDGVLDGVLDALRTGCQWRALPRESREYGPGTTVHDRFSGGWKRGLSSGCGWPACSGTARSRGSTGRGRRPMVAW